MSVTAQKFLVAALSMALFVALLVVARVDSARRARSEAAHKAAVQAMLNPQLERGRRVYEKYSCSACHGAGGAGGVLNINAATGGKITDLLHVAETYTKDELGERIQKGVVEVSRADPTGPEPPLRMPSYRKLIGGQELEDLEAYLLSLGGGAGVKRKEEW